MKRNLLTLSLVLLAFIFGYWTGSYRSDTYLNNTPLSELPSITGDKLVQEAQSRNEISNCEPDTLTGKQRGVDKHLSNTNSTSDNFSGQHKTNSRNTNASGQKVIHEPSPLILKDFPLAQNDLEEWQVQHEEQLKDQMNRVLGDASKFMFDKIEKESPLFTKATAESSLEDDLAWRYEAEQAIKDFILSNSTDPSAVVQMVVCIQKMCEITMTGEDREAAVDLYMQIMVQKPYDLKDASTPTFLTKEDSTYWLYLVLSFN